MTEPSIPKPAPRKGSVKKVYPDFDPTTFIGSDVGGKGYTYSAAGLKKATSGITLVRGFYRVIYVVNGKQATKSLKTNNMNVAIERRNRFYDELAKIIGHQPYSGKNVGMRFITLVQHFTVRIREQYVGVFKTLDEAKKWRDEAMQEMGIGKLPRRTGRPKAMRYIYPVRQYSVNIRGNYIGAFKTKAEAIKWRDEALTRLKIHD